MKECNNDSKDNMQCENNEQIRDNKDLIEEIQDLESQILDMFEVAFHFAGLKEEYLQNALECYMQIMESQDELWEEQPQLEYTPQVIIANILQVKDKNPKWFSK